jgi:hypothetical protein
MNKETAQFALKFLERTDLKGIEMPAFAQVFNALKAIVATPDVPPPPPPEDAKQ